MHLSLKEKENTLYMTLVKLAFLVLSLVMADNRIRQKMRSIVVEEKKKKKQQERSYYRYELFDRKNAFMSS